MDASIALTITKWYQSPAVANSCQNVKQQKAKMTTPQNNAPSREALLNQIYAVVRLIPQGRVTSYGAIAACIGLRSGARFVGWAMNLSHNIPNIPAHRVVNSHGLLTGKHHFGTPTTMQRLLEAEGIVIENDKVKDFKKIYWDPQKEIQI